MFAGAVGRWDVGTPGDGGADYGERSCGALALPAPSVALEREERGRYAELLLYFIRRAGELAAPAIVFHFSAAELQYAVQSVQIGALQYCATLRLNAHHPG